MQNRWRLDLCGETGVLYVRMAVCTTLLCCECGLQTTLHQQMPTSQTASSLK